MVTFTAKDGDGVNFEIGTHLDPVGGIHWPVVGLHPSFPLVAQFFDSLGTGAGTINAVGDYSLGATDFWIEPPSGEIWHITKIIGYLRYTGALRAERFGNATLTNGIRWIKEENTVEMDFTAQKPHTALGDSAAFLGQAVEISEFGTGDNFASWAAQTTELTGNVVELIGDTNDKFIIRLNDNHSDLNEHLYRAYGYKLTG